MASRSVQFGYAVEAASLAVQAYGGIDSLPAGWTAVSSAELIGLNGSLSASDFDNGYFRAKADALSSILLGLWGGVPAFWGSSVDWGQALVARKVHADGTSDLALVFRGTEGIQLSSIQDWISNAVGGGVGWSLILDTFAELIEAFQKLSAAPSVRNVLIAGHSQGGALVEEYLYQNFDSRQFGITIASPGAGHNVDHVTSNSLNFGHSEDLVNDLLGYTPSNDLNIVLVDESGFVTEHDQHLYRESINRILSSTFANQIPSNFIGTTFVLAAHTSTIRADSYASASRIYAIGTGLDDSIYGGYGNDFLIGDSGQDHIWGGQAADQVSGGDGSDQLYGDGHNDTLIGGFGDDTVDGGDGTDDLAVFAGAKNNFTVSKSATGELLIIDGTGTEGTDTLIGIERIKFGNETMRLATFLAEYAAAHPAPPPPPPPPDDHTTPGVLAPTPVVAFTDTNGAIETATDTDRFAVQLVAGRKYAFSGMAAASGLDPIVRLYTASGSLLVANNNIAAGMVNAFVTYTAATTGTYYIEMAGANGTTGAYYLVTSDITQGSAASGLTETAQPADPSSPSGWDWQGNDDDNYPSSLILGGNTGNNRYRGHDGDDTIKAGNGNDVVWGDADEDRLYGENGNDTLKGGDDDDYLSGADGDDVLHGEEDDDDLNGGDGDDYLHGGDGNDELSGNDDEDYLKGGRHNDDLSGGNDDDQVYGDEGDDEVDGNSGNDIVKGGDGDDTVGGGSGDDLLDGEDDDDLIEGDSGNDRLYGGSGSDTLIGGPGDDYINGWTGDDWLSFEGGSDPISVNLFDGRAISDETGSDTFENIDNVIGGSDDDRIDGNHSANKIKAYDGDDIVRGHNGADYLEGEDGNDTLWGDEGNDTVDGGDDADEVRGGLGDDLLYGSWGDDELRGEQGNDTIDGGTGTDRAFFWGERDDFSIVQNGDGSYTVVDLRPDGLEATDLVSNVEVFGFFDGDVAAANILSLAPTAYSDSEATGEDAPIIIDVAANDTDPEGDQLTPASVELAEGKGQAYVVAGKIVFDPRGAWDYLNFGQSATVDLTYEVTDGNARTSQSSITLTLTGDFEHVTGTTASETLSGGAYSDRIVASSGHDKVDGRDGRDSILGGSGNDTIKGAAGFDTLDGGADTDTADYSDKTKKVEIALDGSTPVAVKVGGVVEDSIKSIENTIGGTAGDKLTGDGLANNFKGLAGDDTLAGGGGNDTLVGGAGRDFFTGGANNDRFDFNAISESGITSSTRDVILDFKTGQDRIDLSTIDANTTTGGNQAFALLAKGSAGSAVAKGKIGWYQSNVDGTANDKTILRLNVDNDATIEMQIELKGLVNLTAADFIL